MDPGTSCTDPVTVTLAACGHGSFSLHPPKAAQLLLFSSLSFQRKQLPTEALRKLQHISLVAPLTLAWSLPPTLLPPPTHPWGAPPPELPLSSVVFNRCSDTPSSYPSSKVPTGVLRCSWIKLTTKQDTHRNSHEAQDEKTGKELVQANSSDCIQAPLCIPAASLRTSCPACPSKQPLLCSSQRLFMVVKQLGNKPNVNMRGSIQ